MFSPSLVPPRLFLATLVCALFLAPVAAQQSRAQRTGQAETKEDLVNARPGRDPKQPIDEEYTKKIKEYTTEPFFTSPLVDYLPASKTVPTPKAVLGDIAGAPASCRTPKRSTSTCGCSRRRRRA